MAPCYEAARNCQGHAPGQPGTVAWSHHVRQKFAPGLHWGICNCRLVRHGGSYGSTLSTHSQCRAADDFFPGPGGGADHARTSAAADYAVAVAAAWGIQEVIDYHANRRWTCDHGWEHFDGGGDNWLHVAQNWQGALGLTSAFTSGPPTAPPVPEEEEVPFSNIVLDPNRPPLDNGRNPYFVADLSPDHKNVLCMNGARLVNDTPSTLGFRYWEVPSVAPLQGLALWSHDDKGRPIYPLRLVATAIDGATFVREIRNAA